MANVGGTTLGFLFHEPGNPAFPTGLPLPSDPFTIVAPINLQLVAAIGRAAPTRAPVVGATSTGMLNWFIDKIWVNPVPVDFGSIIGSSVRQVSIFSSFDTESQTLSNIDFTNIGVGVSSDIVLPRVLAPFETVLSDFTATAAGPPSFDDDVDFVFSSVTISVRFIGRRLVLFAHRPQTPILIQRLFETQIRNPRNAEEQRASIRTVARERIRFTVRQSDEQERSRLRTLLYAFRPFIFGIPMWNEMRVVTAPSTAGTSVLNVDTTDIDHRVGGTVAVYSEVTRTFFDAQIASLTSSSITLNAALSADVLAGSIVLPVRFGYLVSDPQTRDAPFGAFDTVLSFETTDGVDLGFADQAAVEAEFTVHPTNDLIILSDPNLLESFEHRRESKSRLVRLDNTTGEPIQFSDSPVSSYVTPVFRELESLAQVRKWTSFADWVKGSWRSFYLPTFRNDLPPQSDFTLNATSLTIEPVGFATFFGVQEPLVTLMLELPDGRQFFADVSSATDGGTFESLVLSAAFDPVLSDNVVAATARISFCELVRVDGDVFTFNHREAGDCAFAFSVRSVRR